MYQRHARQQRREQLRGGVHERGRRAQRRHVAWLERVRRRSPVAAVQQAWRVQAIDTGP